MIIRLFTSFILKIMSSHTSLRVCTILFIEGWYRPRQSSPDCCPQPLHRRIQPHAFADANHSYKQWASEVALTISRWIPNRRFWSFFSYHLAAGGFRVLRLAQRPPEFLSETTYFHIHR